MDHIIEHWIAQYGLIAVFLGCLLEGETAALLGGFFAHQQAFALWQTVLAAFCGATLGDTGFFLLGRRFALAGRVVFCVFGWCFGPSV